jgi:hypothetical protein
MLEKKRLAGVLAHCTALSHLDLSLNQSGAGGEKISVIESAKRLFFFFSVGITLGGYGYGG